MTDETIPKLIVIRVERLPFVKSSVVRCISVTSNAGGDGRREWKTKHTRQAAAVVVVVEQRSADISMEPTAMR